MRKIFVLSIAALFVAGSSNAQLGEKLFNKVKNKASQRADRKVDQTIDKGLDEIEGKKSGGTSAPETTSKPEAKEEVAAAEPSLQSFSKFDFVPGEQIVYFDNFDGEAIAELPTNWNTSGSGEVVTLDKFPGQWLRLHAPFMYLSSNTKEFTENFTAEFDIIMQLKNNGWMYPEVKVGFFASGDVPANDNSFLREYDMLSSLTAIFSPGEFKSSKIKITSYKKNVNHFHSEPKVIPVIEQFYGKPLHVSIQVQKERFRMWINEEKVFDVPKGIPPGQIMNQIFFQIGSTNYKDDQYAMYISNIKVATGKPDTRHKLVEEGKFSTTGILFDVNSATIKPESTGVLKEIADVLKKFPDIKVKIVGHTDSDGSDKTNLELSKKRAASVKTALAKEFGIEEARVETDGKGETEPVADNKTKEAKAQNRRVEFIKQ